MEGLTSIGRAVSRESILQKQYLSKDLKGQKDIKEAPELVMDREAWHDAIHGVTKRWTRLSD